MHTLLRIPQLSVRQSPGLRIRREVMTRCADFLASKGLYARERVVNFAEAPGTNALLMASIGMGCEGMLGGEVGRVEGEQGRELRDHPGEG